MGQVLCPRQILLDDLVNRPNRMAGHARDLLRRISGLGQHHDRCAAKIMKVQVGEIC